MNILLGVSNLSIGLIMILVSLPLKKGMVNMNTWYGFRFSKSFDSDDAWHKINEFGAQRFIKWSIPIIIAGLVAFVLPFEDNILLILFFSFFPMIILIPVYECYQFTKNM